jgi:hypothetical protein
MNIQYGLLGILALLPVVSPLPARAEETPTEAVVEQAETPSNSPINGAETEPPLIDPCAICPVPVVTPAPATPPPTEPVAPVIPMPAPTTPVAPAPVPTPVAAPAATTVSESTGASTPTATPAPKLTSYPTRSVRINEFVSDPLDGVEWIEIVNTTEDEIDLTGWTVKDATTSKTALPAQSLPGHAYFVIQNPKGRLNNDGDSIFLFDATGATIDAISYDKITAPKKGKSLARMEDDSWKSGDPTPLAPNTTPLPPPSEGGGEIETNTSTTYATTHDTATTIPNPQPDTGTTQGTDNAPGTASPVRVEREPEVEESLASPLPPPLRGGGEAPITSAAANHPSPGIPVIDASEVTNYDANTTVTVDGVLVAAPGTFGKQIAYIDGLEIYFNKADWPKLSAMTRVRMTGTVDIKADYTRLKIKKRSDIKIVGDDAVAPDDLETLDDARHGLLMSLSGSVVDVTGKKLTIGLGNGELIAATSAKDASVDFSALAYDDHIAVTGIVRLVKGSWTLTILDQSGLTTLTGGAEVTARETTPQPPPFQGGGASEPIRQATSTIKAPAKSVPWVGGGLLTTSIGALGYWFAKAKGITLPSFS